MFIFFGFLLHLFTQGDLSKNIKINKTRTYKVKNINVVKVKKNKTQYIEDKINTKCNQFKPGKRVYVYISNFPNSF